MSYKVIFEFVVSDRWTTNGVPAHILLRRIRQGDDGSEDDEDK